MEALPDQRPAHRAGPDPAAGWPRAWRIPVVGLLVFPIALAGGRESDLWLPALGLGVALLAWTSWWLLPLLTAEIFLVRIATATNVPLALCDSLLLSAQIGLSWWAYHSLARGSRWLEDPRSCMLFLVLVPGLIAAAFALIQVLIWMAFNTDVPLWTLFGSLWISRILGLVVPLPLLFVLIAPLLVQRRLIAIPPPSGAIGNPWQHWSTGEFVEVVGLTLASAVLTLVLLVLQVQQGLPSWSLGGVGLMIVVWAALRQGLRGGVMVATVGSLTALALAELVSLAPIDRGPLQGYLLAQCSTALLVGVSAAWIQASEARYRHVVGEVPLVLYSVHLPRALAVPSPDRAVARVSRGEALGPTISREAIVTLVSRASRLVFGHDPEEMTGPYEHWLDRIVPEDRELLIAALDQLGRQRQAVTCEYRVPAWDAPVDEGAGNGAPSTVRWVRDSLTPHYTADGLLDGWEGFVEDITEARRLAYSLRRSTTMLQALVANLPTGVFFVQGPLGFPLLANGRARQLLGQREDGSIPLAQLSRLYRLHRPDGSEYPADELPVARALRLGVSCTSSDIVVHRPDGRKIPLISWAAPVQLAAESRPDAAVWVLEDLTSFNRDDSARRASESLLRVIIESMAEGMLVQDAAGAVIECNPAACRILGLSRERLVGATMSGADIVCYGDDGSELPPEEFPDRRALASGAAVRQVLVSISRPGMADPGWLLLNVVPLPPGPATGPHPARLVTTFAEITGHVILPKHQAPPALATDMSHSGD